MVAGVSSQAWCSTVTPPCPHSLPCMAQEEELIQSENSASIFNTLSDIPSQIEDAEVLLGVAMRLAGSLTEAAVETQRRKHLAYLIADQGQLLGTGAATNLSQVGPEGGGPTSPTARWSLKQPFPALLLLAKLSPQGPTWPNSDHSCGESTALAFVHLGFELCCWV